jgi:hypothetical protein
VHIAVPWAALGKRNLTWNGHSRLKTFREHGRPMADDPDGDRWVRLIDDAVATYAGYVLGPR